MAARIQSRYIDWVSSAACAARLSLCYTIRQAEEGYGRLARRSGSDNRTLPLPGLARPEVARVTVNGLVLREDEAGFRMDGQEQAQQALKEMFRRDRAKVAAHPPRKPRWQLGPLALPWLLAIAAVIFVLGPFSFIVIYPRFGPVDTMTSFCTAEGVGEYGTAYSLLSKRAQRQAPLDAFAQASRDANLESCSASHGVPIIFGGTQASLDANYVLVNGGSERDGSMTFVRENGAWRVDSMTPDLFGISS